MAVDDSNTIDIVSTEKSGNVVLTISDHLEWQDEYQHLITLQAKLNGYLRFVESGEILTAYPNSRNHSISFEVVFQYPPTSQGQRFLRIAKELVGKAGMEFPFRVWE